MESKEIIDYFISATTEKFNRLDQRFDKIDGKLDDLVGFRFMILGGSAVVACLSSTAIVLIAAWLEKH